MSKSPLATFLPGVNAAEGPFALLGIAPDDCSPAGIDAALRARLRVIDEHKHARTTEADELRAALHTAAAHLHHPAIRAAAIERFAKPIPPPTAPPSPPPPSPVSTPAQPFDPRTGTGAPPPRPTHYIPIPPGPIRLPPEEEAYRDLVVRVLVHAGGWNETAKRRLAAVTHLHNRPIRHLQAALRLVAIAGPSRQYRPIVDASARDAELLHDADPTTAPVSAAPPQKRPRQLLLAASILFTVNSIVLLIVFAFLLRERMALHDAFAVSSNAPAAAAAGDPGTMSAAEARARLEGMAQEPADEPIARLAAIRSATANLPISTSASMAAFNANATALAAEWMDLDPPIRLALVTAVSDFVAAAARQDPAEAMRAIDTIARGSDPIARLSAMPRADQLRHAAFSIAMLARLRRDRDLSSTVAAALERRLAPFEQMGGVLPGQPARGASFEDGLALALRALAWRITPKQNEQDPEPAAALWRVWLALANAAVEPGSTGSLHLDTRLDAMEHLLLEHPGLHAWPAAQEATRLITASIDWTDPLASRRLLRWFDVEAFSLDDRNTILSWLAVAMPDRIGSDLILPSNALPSERASARDRLAMALGSAVRPASEFDAALIARGNSLIDEASRLSPGTPNRRALLLAAALASFNEACARRWNQDRGGAEVAFERASLETIEARLAAPGSGGSGTPLDLAALTAPAQGNDGEWALRVLQTLRDRETLAGLLNQVANAPRELGPADAGVLIDAALAYSSTPVRDAAQRAVRRHAAEPTLMEAFLQHTALGRRGLDRLVAEVARAVTGVDLPHWSDQRFPLEARRAILSAHIARIAGAREPGIDELSWEIARSHRETARAARIGAGLQPGPAGAGDRRTAGGQTRPDPALAAAALADTYQTIASLGANHQTGTRSLSAIATRRRARQALGSDGVQRFHAEQVAAAELLAHIVGDEQPALVDAIDGALRVLAESRAMASSVTHQIAAAESAMAELWIMRLGYHEARRMVPDPAAEPGSLGGVPARRPAAGDVPNERTVSAIRVVP